MDEIQTIFLLAIQSHLYNFDFLFFELSQPLIVSTVQLLYTVKEKREKPVRNPNPILYGLRNPHRNLKIIRRNLNDCTFMNSASVLYSAYLPHLSNCGRDQDYSQKPQRRCTFMNSASVLYSVYLPHLSNCGREVGN